MNLNLTNTYKLEESHKLYISVKEELERDLNLINCYKFEESHKQIKLYISVQEAFSYNLNPFQDLNFDTVDFNSKEVDKISFKRGVKRAYQKNEDRESSLVKARNFDKMAMIFLLYIFIDYYKPVLKDNLRSNFSTFSSHLVSYVFDYHRLLQSFKEYLKNKTTPLVFILPTIGRENRGRFTLEDLLRFTQLTLEACKFIISENKNIECKILIGEWGDGNPIQDLLTDYKDLIHQQRLNASIVLLYRYLHLDTIQRWTPEEHANIVRLIPNEAVLIDMEKELIRNRNITSKVLLRRIANNWFERLYINNRWLREILIQLYVESNPTLIENVISFINYEEDSPNNHSDILKLNNKFYYKEELHFNPLVWSTFRNNNPSKFIDKTLKSWMLTRDVIIKHHDEYYSINPLLKLASQDFVNRLIKNIK